MDWSFVSGAGRTPPRIAAEGTGRGIRVAVVDTGVTFAHPHLALPPAGVHVERVDGAIEVIDRPAPDRHGHGTCVAALVRWLAPDAAIFSVRVTSDRPTTDADRLAVGIREAVRGGATVAAVALGTRTTLRAALDDAVQEALRAGVVVVAVRPSDAVLPGACEGAIGVRRRDGVDVVRVEEGVGAEGLARPIPGHARNFEGESLAVARTAAALARYAESRHDRGADLARGFSNSLDVG